MEEKMQSTNQPNAEKSENPDIMLHLTEKLINKFSGQDEAYTVSMWIRDVEEHSEIFMWNPIQTLLVARRSLVGTAALWLRAEKTFKSWEDLKTAIGKEFPDTLDMKKVHEIMSTRRKKRDETCIDYMLVMKELGKRGKMPDYVAIKYIVEGIIDTEVNKMMLYGVVSYTELKEKLKLYELFKKNSAKDIRNKAPAHNSHNSVRRDTVPMTTSKRCFGCGEMDHISENCPHRSQGRKCFRCGEFGHISSDSVCPLKKKTMADHGSKPSQSHSASGTGGGNRKSSGAVGRESCQVGTIENEKLKPTNQMSKQAFLNLMQGGATASNDVQSDVYLAATGMKKCACTGIGSSCCAVGSMEHECQNVIGYSLDSGKMADSYNGRDVYNVNKVNNEPVKRVTYITPILENSHPKLHQVNISSHFQYVPKEVISISKIMNKEEAEIDPSFMMSIMTTLLQATYEHENVQKLINNLDVKFDLVIVEWMFSELGAGFSAVFNAPLVWLSSVEPHWMVLRLIDEALNPAYCGDAMSGNMPPFSFLNRVQELWTQIMVLYFINRYSYPAESEIYDKHIAPLVKKRGGQPGSFDEVRYNASLMFGNSHVSLGVATRLPQSYKPIGGYHIDEDVKPLPEDLQKIMDNAQKGVIYFSMGSNLKSKDMPDELKKSLLKMFSELEQTVFWKFEEDFLNVPKNVHMLKWAPQQSILAHPNCVLFITHGGLLSTTETIHFGVPIIGIPVYGDQSINVQRAVSKGFAKKVDLSYTMVDDLKKAIVEMTRDPKYKQKVKELSFIYHDRPVRPGAELVHWVEHVIKTKGAPHLRSPALNVPWYHKMYLDLAAVVLVVLIVIVWGLKRLYKAMFSKKVVSDKKYR